MISAASAAILPFRFTFSAMFVPQLLGCRGWASKGTIMHRTFRLDLDSTVLLMIDFQELYRCDPRVMAHDYGDLLLRAATVQRSARAHKVPVVHSGQFRRTDGDVRDGCTVGPLTRFSAETAPEGDEPGLLRDGSSALSDPALVELLELMGCDTLVIAGVWTEACVAATVRDAVDAGLRVLIIKDACGSATELMHRTATLNLGNRLYGGGILDARRANELLAGREAAVWMLEEVIPFRYLPETVTPLYNAL